MLLLFLHRLETGRANVWSNSKEEMYLLRKCIFSSVYEGGGWSIVFACLLGNCLQINSLPSEGNAAPSPSALPRVRFSLAQPGAWLLTGRASASVFAGEGHLQRSRSLWHRPLRQLAWRPRSSPRRTQTLPLETAITSPPLSAEKSLWISFSKGGGQKKYRAVASERADKC